MRMRLSGNARRGLALALLLLALASLYGLLLQPWLLAPLQQQSEEETVLLASYQRYWALETQRAAIEARLAAADNHPLPADSLLAGTTPEVAQAQMMQLLVDRMSVQPDTGLPCEMLNRAPRTPSLQGQLTQLVVDVQMRCGIEALAATLYRFENEPPYLLVDALDIRRQDAGGSQGSLAVRLQIRSYQGRGEGQGHE
ncbi:type II secretion system protein GspM [Pseudomonas sp. GD03858]|uniref:type II secretion system protein GspM n=1 Tax=unclassified Pseudomonas TaxID=196821 RepID=UPI002447E5CC|nr:MULTISPECIES: type II secretion system protein GspM [unclassified Pseudomonas]MDH0648596.1 type II secretion system protein GspM [Pseudomonas sp. GD03867]MDH0664603.1 type II secretion system protein GspM [Pseudomonas sp. GD03858]